MTTEQADDLERALAAFGEVDLDRLLQGRGLPGSTPLRRVADAWGSDSESYARHFLGDPPREAFWCASQLPRFRGGVQVWFDDEVVLKIEGAWPDLPAEQLPAAPTSRVLSNGSQEHLWPEQGVALTTNSSGGVVTKLAVFTPTTEADYLRALAPFLESREEE